MKLIICILLFLASLSSFAQGGYAPWGFMSWKEPVANVAALPVGGNTPGDARVTEDTYNIWVWNGTIWVDQSGSGSVVPGGASGDVQFNNAGTFGGNADFTYSGSGSITLTNPGGSSAITSNGNGLSQLILNDTSGSYADSIVFDNAEAMIYNLQMAGSPSLDLIDEQTGNNMLAWDSSDNLTIPAQLTMDSTVEPGFIFVNGNGTAGMFLNDTSGADIDAIILQNQGNNQYALATTVFGALGLLDYGTGTVMESWDVFDNMSVSNAGGSSSPALTVNQNGMAGSQYALDVQQNGSGGGINVNSYVNIQNSVGNPADLSVSDTTGGNTNVLITNTVPGGASGLNFNATGVASSGSQESINFFDSGYPGPAVAGETFCVGCGGGVITPTDYILQFQGSSSAPLVLDFTNGFAYMSNIAMQGISAPAVSLPSTAYMYFDSNSQTLNLSTNASAYSQVLTSDTDTSNFPTSALSILFKGSVSSTLVLDGANGGPSSYSDFQLQQNSTPAFDFYAGNGAPHGNGVFTLWDDTNSVSAIAIDGNDNVTLPALLNLPVQTVGVSPSNPSTGSVAITSTGLLCTYVSGGWVNGGTGLPCTF